jgi:hypothetical protein
MSGFIPGSDQTTYIAGCLKSSQVQKNSVTNSGQKRVPNLAWPRAQDGSGPTNSIWCYRPKLVTAGRRHIVGVLDASTSPPKERYVVSADRRKGLAPNLLRSNNVKNPTHPGEV